MLLWLEKGNHGFLLGVLASSAGLLFVLSTIRLEISRNLLKRRSLFGVDIIQFKDVVSAYISVEYSSKAPQGSASFWIQPRNAAPLKINLRLYPVQAAAMLFFILEAQGIDIDVPDTWSARRMQQQIRAAQAKAKARMA
ncbi:hypothetical protein NRY95_08575 [Xanthomonas campestris pv. phormiicola]|nr:hypothetical protein NRY95_08575 [Xanthomonas campestris pv. phormiicola]